MAYQQFIELFGDKYEKAVACLVKSKEQRAKSKEHRAKSKEQRAKSTEHRAKSKEQRAKSKEQRAKSKEQLFTFYDFPAKHWRHIRTTNIIESAFSTVRHRTRQTKGGGSRIGH